MGVQGLWELLTPVGRRVSVETLAGRKLAIDASIWMVQFMKAMRDDKGEMIRNAHLIGFFRRICKLLYLRVKPVFVFDGGTPALKRRTVIARRRQRERAQAKIRKTAEKLLLNHLRTRKLEELAQEIKNAKGGRKNSGSKNEVHTDKNRKQEAVSSSSTPNENGNYEAGCSSQTPNDICNYEAGDALLAATLTAEEDGQLQKLLSESPEEINSDEDEEMDGSEEMILPVNQGKIDPAVLAVLPPSMQLDLLVQMREQMMAEKRQKFQKVKKAPASFSELQIQAYLKTVAFRREIEEVQKAAAGTGIGGMPTSRIASESDREFIFSSSFTGDKRALCFPGSITSDTEGRPAEEDKAPDPSSVPFSSLTSSMFSGTSVLQGEASNEDSEAPVQTYVNEKGQVCVSRHRGMGVRLTRDLQWNLYLMKESEEQGTNASNNVKETDCTVTSQEVLIDDTCQINDKVENVDMVNIRYENEGLSAACTGGKKILTKDSNHLLCNSGVGGVQISFTEEDIGDRGEDDDFFAALVAGDSDACNHVQDDMYECEWEEGKIQLNEDGNIQGHFITSNFNQVSEAAPLECSVIDGDDEIEWEDGRNVAACETKIPSKSYENSSRKFLSEEEELQEAIKRSLEDFGGQNHRASCSRLIIRETSQETSENAAEVGMPPQQSPCGNELGGTTKKVDRKDFPDLEKESKGKSQITEEDDRDCGTYKSQLKRHTDRSIQISAEKCEVSMNIAENRTKFSKNCSEFVISTPAHKKDTKDPHLLTPNDMQGLVGAEEFARPMEPILSNEVHNSEELCPTIDIEILNDDRVNTLKNSEAVEAVGHHISHSTTSTPGLEKNYNEKMASNDTGVSHTLNEDKVMSEPPGGLTKDDLIREAEEIDSARDREALLQKEAELLAMAEENLRKKEEIEAELEAEKEALQANVDEEMIFLRQEELDLQAAQKKHERNAESVSGEMFAECQELLQMFGLPYIIAPMEAEAQCAYLEFIHLVDGVVTDDCDVFLFGASSVYKNIFDERKYVETYLMKDVEKELGLNRDKLIRMAMLLGSDYTEGISGIGIVNAIEVVNSFPEEDGLKKFREWLDSPDPSLLDKVNACSGQSSRKRLSKSNKKTEHVAEEKEGILDQNTEGGEGDEASEDRNLALKKIFMAKHQAVSKNWHVPDSFPNEAVVSAYTSPQVDKATETFSWGRPDLMSLRKLCWERFGWNKEKADELLLPVLKEYDRRETQLRLEAFYSFNERFAKIRSRRIQKAVTGITGCRSSELMDLPPHLTSTSQKRPRKKKERSVAEADDNLPEQNMVDVGTERTSADVQCSESVKDGEEEGKNEADSIVKIPTRGRGRGKSKGRGGKTAVGRGHSTGDAKNLMDDSDSEKEKTTSHKAQLKRKSCVDIVGIRKSTRPRKAVKYALDEQDSGSDGHSDDDMDFEMSCEALPAKASQKQPQTAALPAKASQKPLQTTALLAKASQKQSQTSAYSFFRDGEQTDIESNLQQREIENPHVSFIRDERQSSDYLATGGSFCFEEDNHGDDLHSNNDNADGHGNLQRQGSENPDVGFRDERQSLDYLAAGGGFCLEEDKYGDDLHTNNNNVDENVKPTVDNTQDNDSDILLMNSSRRATLDFPSSEVKDLSMYHAKESYFKENRNDDSHNDGNLKEADRIAEQKGGNHSSASAAGLRAIPFLRRRKRT